MLRLRSTRYWFRCSYIGRRDNSRVKVGEELVEYDSETEATFYTFLILLFLKHFLNWNALGSITQQLNLSKLNLFITLFV